MLWKNFWKGLSLFDEYCVLYKHSKQKRHWLQPREKPIYVSSPGLTPWEVNILSLVEYEESQHFTMKFNAFYIQGVNILHAGWDYIIKSKLWLWLSL